MARGENKQAKQTFQQAKGVADTSIGNSNSLYSTLTPFYQGEMTNPQGFGADLGAINTAGQQSTGGALSAAKGEGMLRSARSRNRGGDQVAVDESARDAMRTNSQNAVNVQKSNAILKETQRQAGAAGQENLYGRNMGETLGAMGAQNEATNAGVNAQKSGWFQNFIGLMNALKPSGSSANGGSIGFGGG